MSSDIPWTAYGGLLLSALLPIIGGSFDSLSLPKKLKREARANGPKEEQEEEDDIDIERIRSEDAWLFPIIGSAVLFSLFLAFKYLDKKLINQLLGAYFAFVGTAAVARVVIASTKFTVGATRWRRWNVWRLALSRDGKESLRTPKFSAIHLTAIAFAVGITLYQQLVRDHWTTSNLVALSLAFNAVNLLRLDSFGTGSALLGGLFLYDIFWVFGTEILTGTSVMVSVATNFEAPVKVQFPKSLGAYSGFTLLGLGDIVLPGCFIALALRFDYHQAVSKRSPPPHPSDSFARPYFWSVLVAYLAGLVTTIVVMHTFHAAQPALLYLSPACVGSVVLCAVVRGELKEMWAFDDGAEDEEERAFLEEAKKKLEVAEVGEGEVEPEGESTASEGRVLRSRAAKKE